MSLVTPLLFWAGLGLMAIPVVLHLIMRQRPRPQEFPALRFVQTQYQTNRRRLRLRHLVLLLLRMGTIGLLAFALARPSVKLAGVWEGQEAPVAAALVFDTSVRMDYRHQNRTRLEVARELGLWLLGQLPAESQIAVLDTRGGPESCCVDRGAARHRIERLAVSPRAEPLPRAIQRALALLATSPLARREVYVLSDLATVAWPVEGAARLQDRVTDLPDGGVYVVDVGVSEVSDTALGPLRLSGEVLSRQSPLRIETEVAQRGPGGPQTVALYLAEPGAQAGQWPLRPVKRSQQIVDVAASQTRPVEFRVGGLAPGVQQGYVEVTSGDALPWNNRRYFTVEVRPAWRVAIFAPKPPERFAVYLANALAPEALRRSGQARFQCDVLPLDALAEKPLADYAVTCLLDPGPLEPTVWQKLANFAAEGRGVAVFLGRQAGRANAMNQPEAQEVLPGRLVAQARAPDGTVHLAPAALEHPMLRELGALRGNVPWDAFPVLRYWQLSPLVQGSHVVVPLSDGRPVVIERPIGRGRSVTMTTPISDRPDAQPWNLLPVGQAWPFVILANEMMAYLAGASDRRLNYVAGQTVVLPLDPQRELASYVLLAPGEAETAGLRVRADLARHVLTVGAADRLGNYRVRAGGTQDGVDLGFSVNLDPQQTRLDRLAPGTLDEIFGPLPHRLARSRQELVREVSAGRTGYDLVPLVVLGWAVCLAGEMLLANRFYLDKSNG